MDLANYDCSPADIRLYDIASLLFCICLVCTHQTEKLHPVSRYADMFDILKPSRDQVTLAVIARVLTDDPV